MDFVNEREGNASIAILHFSPKIVLTRKSKSNASNSKYKRSNKSIEFTSHFTAFHSICHFLSQFSFPTLLTHNIDVLCTHKHAHYHRSGICLTSLKSVNPSRLKCVNYILYTRLKLVVL